MNRVLRFTTQIPQELKHCPGVKFTGSNPQCGVHVIAQVAGKINPLPNISINYLSGYWTRMKFTGSNLEWLVHIIAQLADKMNLNQQPIWFFRPAQSVTNLLPNATSINLSHP